MPLGAAYNSNSDGSGFDIKNDHIFTNETDRDSYFSINTDELENDMYCSSANSAYKYENGSWVEVSQLKTVKGDNGLDGKSAYQIAVDSGYSGTEANWLLSLRGNDGNSVQSDWNSDSGESVILNRPTLGNMSVEDDAVSDSVSYVRENKNWVANDISKVQGLRAELDSIIQDDIDLTLIVGQKATKTELDSIEQDIDSIETVLSNKLDSSTYTELDVKTKYESNLDTNAFTDAYQSKLDNLTDRFKGVFANSADRDIAITTPLNGDYCKQIDTNSFWFYGSGAWIDTGGTSTGDMTSPIFDPQNIGADVFDRANHTGSQDISSVTGLRADLDSRALGSDLTLVENDLSSLALTTANKLDETAYSAADVKTKYESNLDTNVFTDAEKTKLTNISNNARLTSVVSGDNIDIDDSDPLNPVIKVTGLSEEIDSKVDKSGSKVLSDNNFTDDDKSYLESLNLNITSPNVFAGNMVNSPHELRCVLIEGQYPVEGGNFKFSHGLDSSATVVGVQGGFAYSGDGMDTRQCMPANFTHSSHFEYQIYVSNSSLSFRDISATNLYGMYGSFLITYY